MRAEKRELLISLLIIGALLAAILVMFTGCTKEDPPAPNYIVLPVLEISNPELGRKIMGIRAHFFITVDGDSVVYTLDRDLSEFSKLPCRKGIIGRVIEYEGKAHLTFHARVLYREVGTKGFAPWEHTFSYSNAFTLTFEVREGLGNGLVAPGKFITSTEEDPEPTLEWTVETIIIN